MARQKGFVMSDSTLLGVFLDDGRYSVSVEQLHDWDQSHESRLVVRGDYLDMIKPGTFVVASGTQFFDAAPQSIHVLGGFGSYDDAYAFVSAWVARNGAEDLYFGMCGLFEIWEVVEDATYYGFLYCGKCAELPFACFGDFASLGCVHARPSLLDVRAYAVTKSHECKCVGCVHNWGDYCDVFPCVHKESAKSVIREV